MTAGTARTSVSTTGTGEGSMRETAVEGRAMSERSERIIQHSACAQRRPSASEGVR